MYIDSFCLATYIFIYSSFNGALHLFRLVRCHLMLEWLVGRDKTISSLICDSFLPNKEQESWQADSGVRYDDNDGVDHDDGCSVNAISGSICTNGFTSQE
jgi:hypothetical protein